MGLQGGGLGAVFIRASWSCYASVRCGLRESSVPKGCRESFPAGSETVPLSLVRHVRALFDRVHVTVLLPGSPACRGMADKIKLPQKLRKRCPSKRPGKLPRAIPASCEVVQQVVRQLPRSSPVGRNSGRSGPNLAEFGRNWSIVGRVQRAFADLGQLCSCFGRVWPNSAEHWPILAQKRPNLAKLGKTWATLGNLLGNFWGNLLGNLGVRRDRSG